jgi:X-X-X-Leu-X-X-Gly heptad repeat protein
MPNNIRHLAEDEIDLVIKEVGDALTILRRIQKQLDRSGDDPDQLALVIALRRSLNGILTDVGEIVIAKLGETEAVQGAISTLKQQRKKLDEQVDAGLETAAKLKTAQQVAAGLGKAVDGLAKLAA